VRLVHELIRARRDEIETLCRTLGVHRLKMFGSATGDSFDVDTSDVDVLVEFATPQGFDYFDAYFRLKEGLESILGRHVDVVVESSIRNPYFRQRVMATKELLYAA
jgi:predicted nucleotidyltransferase